MKEITNSTAIKIKGFLFLFLGLLSAGLVLLERPSLRVAALLMVSIWSFCRFYYFGFYVIEHYVDPKFRFSGMVSFARHLATHCQGKSREKM
jgi:hypothetical protein